MSDVIDNMMLNLARNAIINLSRKVIIDTPIDTTAAAKSWTPALNEIKVNNIETDYKAASGFSFPFKDVKNTAYKIKLGDKFYLSNAKEYIRTLEHGHSKQAPRGMLFLNTARWRGIVQDATR